MGELAFFHYKFQISGYENCHTEKVLYLYNESSVIIGHPKRMMFSNI